MTTITTHVRDLTAHQPGQTVALYRVEPAADGVEYVVVSALAHAFDTGRPETFIFAATADGEVTNWLELPGSFSGDQDPERALAGFREQAAKA